MFYKLYLEIPYRDFGTLNKRYVYHTEIFRNCKYDFADFIKSLE